jgi:acyl-CoA synthetase (AMP-forming)/AMP-acid ligase II
LADGDATIIDVLRRWARDDPSRIATTFLRDGERDAEHGSYEALDRRATGLARRLSARLGAGDRVLLAYPPGPEFLAGFFACLYAGLVAVPVAPPRPNQSLAGLEAIAADSVASAAMTTRRLLDALGPRIAAGSSLAGLDWIADDGPSPPVDGRPTREVAPDSLAYLQYTSGSTSEPKGVMIGHDNLMANLREIREMADGPEGGVTVGWLPLYHDMGLVSTALQSLDLGGRCVLMSPLHFLQKPARWPRAIAENRAATSGAPNFAYDLCARSARPEDVDGLDLSGWTGAFCSSEPVRADTLDRFAAAFAAAGFRRDAFYPCYGLAEATVFVTGGDRRATPCIRRFDPEALKAGRAVAVPDGEPGAAGLVGCGWPGPRTRVVVVDPMSRRACPSDRVGEIWVAGPGVGRGYWRRPDATASAFAARIEGGDDRPFLRTGDLGFLDHGELFIAGRSKELILIRGVNYYPQDLERTARAASPVLRPDGGAAFAIEVSGEDRVVIVHEVERSARAGLDLPRLLGDVREAVLAEHGVRVHALVLIRPASLPRTTSGKARRGACRDRLLAGTLDVVAADYGQPDCRGGLA